MNFKRAIKHGYSLTLVMALSGCITGSSPPLSHGDTPSIENSAQTTLTQHYTELKRTGVTVFTLNPKTSSVRIFAFRSGKIAQLGHNHVLSAPQFTGFVYLPPNGVADAHFDLEFRLDQLEIDNQKYRAELGQAFSSTLSKAAIESTREHMLGKDNLDAGAYPFVRIHSLNVSGELPKLATQVQIEMHGQKREMWIPLDVHGLPDHLSAKGEFVLHQTDFGIKPYSILGGMLAVQDEVIVEFNVSGDKNTTM